MRVAVNSVALISFERIKTITNQGETMNWIQIQALMPNVDWDRVAINYAILDCITDNYYNVILEVQ